LTLDGENETAVWDEEVFVLTDELVTMTFNVPQLVLLLPDAHTERAVVPAFDALMVRVEPERLNEAIDELELLETEPDRVTVWLDPATRDRLDWLKDIDAGVEEDEDWTVTYMVEQPMFVAQTVTFVVPGLVAVRMI
jgi:hypothetical protein